MGQGAPSNFNTDDLKKFTIYQLFQILNSQIMGLSNGGNPPPISKILDEHNLGPKRSTNIEKSMSNISNDAGPFGQGSGEDGADGFTYDDMALTEGVQDPKRKQNRFMNKKRKQDERVLKAIQSASNLTNVNQLISPTANS